MLLRSINPSRCWLSSAVAAKYATLTVEQIKAAVMKIREEKKLKGESPNLKLEQMKVNAMLKAEAAKAKIKDGANMAADKTEKAYEGAKEKAKEIYETAKDTVAESAKSNHEAAKEKASQATGDLGAMMQQKTVGEL